MSKVKISIERIRELKAELHAINKLILSNIIFTEKDKPVKISKKIIDDFEYTGLTNIDFIMSDFYKRGFKTEKRTGGK